MHIQVDYDPKTNAAYLYLVSMERGRAARSLSVPHEGIILDFSKENTLIGIEVLEARSRLPARVIGAALLEASSQHRSRDPRNNDRLNDSQNED